jgi:hypothetical protein
MTTPRWETYNAPGLLTEHLARRRELTSRDLVSRSIAQSQAEGTYTPSSHLDPADYPPLTITEHLEVLAIGEALARHFRHPAGIHQAIAAGATWEQIADAIGTDIPTLRRDYQAWADGQHHLYQTSNGQLGITDAEHAAAIQEARKK